MRTQNPGPKKPLLFTLHGMHDRSHWQEGADVVLAPHFHHRKIDYKQFQHWAVVQLSGDIILTLFWICLGFFLWTHTKPASAFPLLAGIYLPLALASVYYVNIRADNKRTRLVNELRLSLPASPLDEDRPSLIAHSLGTYLIACMLLRYRTVAFNVLIFNGCVVRRSFPWKELESRFARVINEVGGLDFVPYLAPSLGWTVPNMGAAGALGFKGAAVHPGLLDREEARPQCMHKPNPCCPVHNVPTPPCPAPVHNILHRGNSHGNFHRTTEHAWRYWLPALWQLDPQVYDDFRKACDKYDSATTQQAELAAIQHLLDSCWEWTNGSLRNFAQTYLRKLVGATCPSECIELMTSTALFELANTFVLARRNASLKSGHDPELMLALDPRKTFSDLLGATAQNAMQAGLL